MMEALLKNCILFPGVRGHCVGGEADPGWFNAAVQPRRHHWHLPRVVTAGPVRHADAGGTEVMGEKGGGGKSNRL